MGSWFKSFLMNKMISVARGLSPLLDTLYSYRHRNKGTFARSEKIYDWRKIDKMNFTNSKLTFILLFIFRVVRRHFVPGNMAVQLRQRKSILRIVHVTLMSVISMMLSWAPYCCISLASVVRGKPVIEDWEAEIPELLAKASVVYNPLIYTFMNKSFRMTLFRIVGLHRCFGAGQEVAPTAVIQKRPNVIQQIQFHRHSSEVEIRTPRVPPIEWQPPRMRRTSTKIRSTHFISSPVVYEVSLGELNHRRIEVYEADQEA